MHARNAGVVGWTAVLGVLLAVPAVAGPPRAARVAVFQIHPGGLELSDEKLAALSHYLDSKISDAGVEAIPWDEIFAHLRAHEQYMCFDRTCQVEVERALGADYSLAVQILPLGKVCSLSATLYPAGEPASQRTALVKGGCQEDALLVSLDELVASLAAQGGWPPEARAGGEAGQLAGGGPPALAAAGAKAFPNRLSFSGLYSPVPIVTQAGPSVAFEHDLIGPLFLGAQAEALFDAKNSFFVPGLRLGVVFRFGERLSLLVRLMAGMSYLSRSESKRLDYLGFRVGLGTGVRFLFHPHVGVQFEVAGTNDTVFLLDDGERAKSRFAFFKLDLALGLVVAF